MEDYFVKSEKGSINFENLVIKSSSNLNFSLVSKGREKQSTSMSVNFCHLSVTTKYFPSRLRQLKSNTSRSFPTRSTISWSRTRSIFPPVNTYDVTITCEAPASRYLFSTRWKRSNSLIETYLIAFSGVIPPPMCIPPGYAESALSAASSLPGPSIITCPPFSPARLYSSAK